MLREALCLAFNYLKNAILSNGIIIIPELKYTVNGSILNICLFKL